MEAKDAPVNAGVEPQGINVGKERLQIVTAQAFVLLFVEGKTFSQVLPAPTEV